LAVTIKKAVGGGPAVVIGYGKFILTVIDFIIIAFVLFIGVKGINSMKRKAEEVPKAPPEPSTEVVLLSEIRDLLKEGK